MSTTDSLTVRKARPAADGFGDRAATYHISASYEVVDGEGRVRATIERMGNPSYMDNPDWQVTTFQTDGTRRYTAYRRLLREAKESAKDMVAKLDSE